MITHVFLEDNKIPKELHATTQTWVSRVELFYTWAQTQPTEGHFTHETESPWPLHFKHSHWWKRWIWAQIGCSHVLLDLKIARRGIDLIIKKLNT